jgi:hypothetical protein
MSKKTLKNKANRKGFNIEFGATGLRSFRGLLKFTGWTGKRVIERSLILANKNRSQFLNGGGQS